MGKPQVIGLPVAHPAGQGVAFPGQLAAASGVKRDPGVRGVAEPAGVLVQHLGVDGVLPGGEGGTSGVLEGQQRVGGLLRPDHVISGAGLGDRGQLA
jgi:hypothetical protein